MFNRVQVYSGMSVMVHVYCKGGLSMVTRACVHIVDYVCGGIGQVLVRY